MKHFLIVVDMQKDFVDGALGTPEAQAIVGNVMDKILGFDGQIFATLDTHRENYLDTAEGRKLPVPHCIKGTPGWTLNDAVAVALEQIAYGINLLIARSGGRRPALLRAVGDCKYLICVNLFAEAVCIGVYHVEIGLLNIEAHAFLKVKSGVLSVAHSGVDIDKIRKIDPLVFALVKLLDLEKLLNLLAFVKLRKAHENKFVIFKN